MPQPKILTLTDSSDDLDVVIFTRPVGETLLLQFTRSGTTLDLSTATLQATISPGPDRNPLVLYHNSDFTSRSASGCLLTIAPSDTDSFPTRRYYIEVRRTDTGFEQVVGAFIWDGKGSPSQLSVIPPTPPTFMPWLQIENTPTTIGGYGITDAQTLNAILTAFGGLTLSANQLPYANGTASFALTSLTSFGRTLIDDADAATARTTLGVPAGSGTSNGTNNGDQTIALTGDVTGSGTGTFAATLANTAVTAGAYVLGSFTVDAKGRLTTASSATTTGSGTVVLAASPALTGTPTAPTAAQDTNSTQVATTAFVVTQVTAAVAGLWDDRGSYDASGNTFPASGGSGTAGAIIKGDIWTISVAGTLGGTSVRAGDTVRALADSPGQTAGSWSTAEHNLGYLPLNPANNLSDLASASLARGNLGLGNVDNTSDANKPVSTAQQTALNLKAPLNAPAFTGGITVDGIVLAAGNEGTIATIGDVAANVANLPLDLGGNISTVGTSQTLIVTWAATAVVTHLVVRKISGTTTTGPTVSLGSSAGATDILAATSLAGLITAGQSYMIPIPGLLLSMPAGSKVYFNVTAGSSGGSGTRTIHPDLIGYFP